ncbi:DUF5711 family protein [Acetivibrio cellulolyticus]|uniref:DUF5711 family protein n=1 Tax=Acetivibrio cellulolyticus TaxID=35830 RepID=UPI0001E2FAFC|nr:DUF5711 family protein [Acetivibrio cellulolyticus]
MGLSENTSRQDGNRNGIKIVAFLVLLLIIAGTAGVAYLRSQDVDLKSLSLKDLFGRNFLNQNNKFELSSTEYEYDANLNTVFGTHNGYIVKCTRDSIMYLDTNGNEQWSFPLSLNNPIVKTAGSYLLVADYGAKSILVFKGKDMVWEKALDNNIINTDINSKGYISVVHGEERSRGAVSVYNRQGMKCFTVGKAENFIISSKVSPSGKKVFINSVDTSGVNTNTILEFADVSGKMLDGKVTKENTIFPSLWFMDDDNLLAVGDSVFMMLDKNFKQKWQQNVNGKIFSSCIAEGKYAIVAANPEDTIGIFESGSAGIWVYNSDGKKISEYDIKGEVKNLSSLEDIIAVNSGNELRIIDLKARLLAEYKPKGEIKEAFFISRREVLLVYKDRFSVLQMK